MADGLTARGYFCIMVLTQNKNLYHVNVRLFASSERVEVAFYAQVTAAVPNWLHPQRILLQ